MMQKDQRPLNLFAGLAETASGQVETSPKVEEGKEEPKQELPWSWDSNWFCVFRGFGLSLVN